MDSKRIIALTRSLGRQKMSNLPLDKCIKTDSCMEVFHFKGFYLGLAVKKLVILDSKTSFQRGMDYIIEIDNLCYFNGLLIGKEMRSRSISELRFKNFV